MVYALWPPWYSYGTRSSDLCWQPKAVPGEAVHPNIEPPSTSDTPRCNVKCAASERDWETKFRAIPEPANLHAYMQRLSARPHHVGSPTTRTTPSGSSRSSRMGPRRAHRNLRRALPHAQEPLARTGRARAFHRQAGRAHRAADPTSGQHDEQLPVYNAYSIDGDVTAPLVYVNYGVPDDYEQLDRLGVSVKGAIVIARYGNSWRGIKPKVAAEHGAIGCLIYSDPREDGYFAGEVFPQGPYRPKDGVQRGSVMDMPIIPATRSLPASARTAKAPSAWPSKTRDVDQDSRCCPSRTAMPSRCWPRLPAPSLRSLARRAAHHLSRRSRPRARASEAEFNWDMKRSTTWWRAFPARRIPDEWIIRGNHHDAWVNGAEDPSRAPWR
jgi:N-acetylated-alpha-linked acidic dipeptidase